MASDTTRVTMDGTWKKVLDGSAALFGTVQHHSGPTMSVFYGPTASPPAVGAELGLQLMAAGIHGGTSLMEFALNASDSVWVRGTPDVGGKVNVRARVS